MSSYTLHVGDCLSVLRTLPDASVDAVVTDPPYNVGYKYASTDDSREDYESWCESWFRECRRVCLGPICITPGHVNMAMWYRIAEPNWLLCWWKPAAMGRSPVGFCNWEPVLFYGKTLGEPGCDVIRASIRPSRLLDWHPCPKPLEWAVGLIELVTQPGMTILDPFLGSGTTGLACRQTGREFVGIEHDPDYLARARDRIEGGPLVGSMPLFAGASA